MNLYSFPNRGRIRDPGWLCVGRESCLPHDAGEDDLPNAGCLELFSPSGLKGNGDYDDHTYSSGIKIGYDTIYILSSISTDNPIYANSLRGCSIIKSGTLTTSYDRYPCPQNSVLH